MELSAYIYAFIIGGAICVIGQLLISLTRLTSARVLVLFVVSGVVLTGLGLYEPLVRLAGGLQLFYLLLHRLKLQRATQNLKRRLRGVKL